MLFYFLSKNLQFGYIYFCIFLLIYNCFEVVIWIKKIDTLLREKTSLNQKQFTKKMKRAKTTYNNYETGKREPDKETLKRFATFFNCTIDYLLGYSDIRNPYKNMIAADKLENDYDENFTEKELFAINQFKKFLKEQRRNKNKDN